MIVKIEYCTFSGIPCMDAVIRISTVNGLIAAMQRMFGDRPGSRGFAEVYVWSKTSPIPGEEEDYDPDDRQWRSIGQVGGDQLTDPEAIAEMWEAVDAWQDLIVDEHEVLTDHASRGHKMVWDDVEPVGQFDMVADDPESDPFADNPKTAP